MINRFLIVSIGFVLGMSCKDRKATVHEQSRISLRIENAYNQKIYMETIPFRDEQTLAIDSASIKERVEEIHFLLKDSTQNFYQLRIAGSRLAIVLINDAPEIIIHADFFNPQQISFEGSNASNSLNDFLRMMQDHANKFRQKNGNSKNLPPPLLNEFMKLQQQNYRNFVDTVTSPAAALYVYNSVDFGNDRSGLKQFITHLGKRFPGDVRVQQLKKDTEEFLSIYEEEYEPGDQAPELILPGKDGQSLALSSFRGKYVLLDFWASWCGTCRNQSSSKVKAHQLWKNKNFTIISVSLDPEKEQWKQAVLQDGYEWPQMIDEKVWNGKAVYTYKFDSIPFNYLIDPQGKIIAKALFGNSLLIKLKQLVK